MPTPSNASDTPTVQIDDVLAGSGTGTSPVGVLVIVNGTYNKTLEEFLLEALGPKHLPLTSLVPLTVIFSLLFITGVLGNISVCAVIIRNPAMHTATNYYLFSLAVSDLNLLILGLPNDLSVYWQQYPFIFGVGICKFRALLSEMVSYTSVLTIVAFSMERYLAICHPLHHYSMSGLKRAIKIIGVVWAVSMASAAPFAVYTTINYLEYPPGSGHLAPESAFCAMLASNIPPNFPIYELSSFFFFFLPMIIILILYTRMGIQIRRRGDGKSISLEGSVHEKRQASSRKAIIRMLTAVVVAFFLCWAPFHAQRLLYIYFWDHPNFPVINEWIYHITGILYYVSSTVNPILYNVMSAKYRLAFKETLCGFMMPQKPRSPDGTNRSDDYTLHSCSSVRASTRSQYYVRPRRARRESRFGDDVGDIACENTNLIGTGPGAGPDGEIPLDSLVMVIKPNGPARKYSVLSTAAKRTSDGGRKWPKAFLWVVRSKAVTSPSGKGGPGSNGEQAVVECEMNGHHHHHRHRQHKKSRTRRESLGESSI